MFEHLADDHGILLRRDAIASGVDDNALHRAVRAGHLVRIRQGVYVLRPVWEIADREERHRLLTRAVRTLYDDTVVLSHVSACLAYGGPVWRLDLDEVHLTSTTGRGERSAARVRHHRGQLLVGDITRDETGWITAPARTALDTASLAGQEAGVVVLDWFLHNGLTTRTELEVTFATMKTWPDTLALHRMLQLADGAAESVAETRSRLLFRRGHLPPPIAQYEVRHANGRLIGRVDFAWPELKVLLEFDGDEKYHRYRRPGESLEQAIMREKRREDALREATGWTVIRLTWADLERPDATIARLRRVLSIAA